MRLVRSKTVKMDVLNIMFVRVLHLDLLVSRLSGIFSYPMILPKNGFTLPDSCSLRSLKTFSADLLRSTYLTKSVASTVVGSTGGANVGLGGLGTPIRGFPLRPPRLLR